MLGVPGEPTTSMISELEILCLDESNSVLGCDIELGIAKVWKKKIDYIRNIFTIKIFHRAKNTS